MAERYRSKGVAGKGRAEKEGSAGESMIKPKVYKGKRGHWIVAWPSTYGGGFDVAYLATWKQAIEKICDCWKFLGRP